MRPRTSMFDTLIGEHTDRRASRLRKLRRLVWQAYYHFEKDNAWVVAGHIAFMGLFALFPFMIFLLALAGFLGQGEADRRLSDAVANFRASLKPQRG